MNKFQVTILGCGSATPTLRHFPTSQIVNIREKLSMVDCGEGTQLQLRKYHINFIDLRNVFISHLHGDHCLGLVGMISSFGLLGRTANLHIYAQKELEDVLMQQLDLFCHKPDFEIVFHAINPKEYTAIYEDRSMTVYTIPLKHSVPSCGFLFKEKPTLPHIKRDMIDFYGIPVSQINNIKNGADWVTEDGTIIPNSRLTTPADPVRSYAYCSDTAYRETIIPYIKDVTLLYHEATYTKDLLERAKKNMHSTAEQAATIAVKAEVKQLMVGHYSARYESIDPILNEAKAVFDNTIAAKEGLIVEL